MNSRSDAGSVSAFFVVMVVAFLSVVSVVAEGGRRLGHQSQAEDLAAEAARAAAATLKVDQASNGVSIIDHDGNRAELQAQAIVGEIDNAEIERFVKLPDKVIVVVRVRGTSFVPGLDIDGVGVHTASAVSPAG